MHARYWDVNPTELVRSPLSSCPFSGSDEEPVESDGTGQEWRVPVLEIDDSLEIGIWVVYVIVKLFWKFIWMMDPLVNSSYVRLYLVEWNELKYTIGDHIIVLNVLLYSNVTLHYSTVIRRFVSFTSPGIYSADKYSRRDSWYQSPKP